jgi:hypothetical protein
MNFSEQEIKKAAEVSEFLMQMSQKHRDRWQKVIKETGVGYPFGDLAYGAALATWERNGKKPADVTFSYEEGNTEDPFLVEFSAELTERFGMRVLSIEEGKVRMAQEGVRFARRVHDWGLN